MDVVVSVSQIIFFLLWVELFYRKVGKLHIHIPSYVLQEPSVTLPVRPQTTPAPEVTSPLALYGPPAGGRRGRQGRRLANRR